MNKEILGLILILTSYTCFGYTFSDAIKSIESHEVIDSLKFESKALHEEGNSKGSWGDPVFRVAAKNFPKDNLSDDQTPMTGIEFGVSQRIALTTKYGNLKEAFNLLAKAKKMEAVDKKDELIKSFWLILINTKRLKEEAKIVNENISWISKILKVSKKLYSNGKITQQALLDIEIRKSELETYYSNKQFEIEALSDQLSYLLNFEGKKINEKSIPWNLLDKKKTVAQDNKELSLKSISNAKNKILNAQKLNYIPDLTLSFGYTKRSDIDDNGDFLSAMVSFPLPFSSVKYAEHDRASYEKYSSAKKLDNYKRFKRSEKRRIETLLNKSKKEYQILSTKTVKFADNSRKVTSKSYTLGNTSYIELLQSELKLQNLLVQKTNVSAKLLEHKVNLKYLIGEKLYE